MSNTSNLYGPLEEAVKVLSEWLREQEESYRKRLAYALDHPSEKVVFEGLDGYVQTGYVQRDTEWIVGDYNVK